MQYSTIGQTHNTIKTPFSVLASHDEAFRLASHDVTKNGNIRPFTPWYAQANQQPLELSESIKESLGFNDQEAFQTEVVDHVEFWQKLCVMGLENNMIKKDDVDRLLESPIGTKEQLNSAQNIGDKILGAYSKHASDQDLKCNAIMKKHGCEIKVDDTVEKWYLNSGWGFDLTLQNIKEEELGSGVDELDQEFDGYGLRITSDSLITCLSFNLDEYNKNLGQLFYFTICFLANLGLKTNAMELSEAYYECSIGVELSEENLTIEQYAQIMTAEEHDDNVMTAFLNTIKKGLGDKLCKLFDSYEIIKGAEEIVEKSGKHWFSDYKHVSSYNDYSFVCKDLLSKIKNVRVNILNTREQLAKDTLIAILNTVLEINPSHSNCPWLYGSDKPLYSFAYVGFGTDAEDHALDSENEHYQCTGELGALRLDLAQSKNGFELIDNIILADKCLMTLCSF